MDMELSDLFIFRTVVEAGGVTRAAERLNRVQSNVTMRIKKLEEELATELFLREGKRLKVSPSGRLLLDYAERLLSLADEARAALHDGRPGGKLRLGAMDSTAAVRLPRVLGELHERFPQVTIELGIAPPSELVVDVLAGKLDAALVAEPVSDPRLETLAIYDEELLLVSDRKQGPVSRPADLLSSRVLAFHPGCPYRARLEQWFADDGHSIERVLELTSYQVMLGCVAAGMGIALVPRSVLASFVGRTRLGLHPMTGKFRTARTLLIWRKAAPQANVALLAEFLTRDPRGRERGLSRRRPVAGHRHP
jgi:DNA-binding transcriptional LysR family regulator